MNAFDQYCQDLGSVEVDHRNPSHGPSPRVQSQAWLVAIHSPQAPTQGHLPASSSRDQGVQRSDRANRAGDQISTAEVRAVQDPPVIDEVDNNFATAAGPPRRKGPQTGIFPSSLEWPCRWFSCSCWYSLTCYFSHAQEKISIFADDERAEGHHPASVGGGVWGHLSS